MKKGVTEVNTDAIIFIIYLLVLLSIGLFFSRSAARSVDSYLLGNREVGPAVTALTTKSTSMSGFMLHGGAAEGFQGGSHAIFYAIGDAGGSVINLSVLARRMRRMSELLKALSPIE